MRVRRNELTWIIALSLLYTVFLSSSSFFPRQNIPPQTIDMKVAGHHWDYYTYLAFIKQGQQGNILPRNLFTHDDGTKMFVPWWPYSLVGFLTAPLSFPPQEIYWIMHAVFTFIVLLLEYAAISFVLLKESSLLKISAFLLLITASPFYGISAQKGLVIAPYDYWYSIGNPFYRYGLPHHVVFHTLLLLCLLITSRIFQQRITLRRVSAVIAPLLLLLITAPEILLLFLFALLLSFIAPILRLLAAKTALFTNRVSEEGMGTAHAIQLKNMAGFFTIIIGSIAPVALMVRSYVSASPSYQSNQAYFLSNYFYPSLSLFTLTTGPILILAIAGTLFYLSRGSFSRLLFFNISFLSFFLALVPIAVDGKNVLSYIPIHNLRFYNSVSYIFLATSAVLFLKYMFKKSLVILTGSLVITSFSLPVMLKTWQESITSHDPSSYFHYMPLDLYKGLSFLASQRDDGIVLTSISSGYGLIVPALSGKRVYLGRTLLTLRYDEKSAASRTFYRMAMEPKEAHRFLTQMSIGYVVLASWEEDAQKLADTYPFLKKVYMNSQLTVFTHLTEIKL